MEDLVPLGATRWLLGGGLNLGAPAHFWLVDGEALTARPLDFTATPAPGTACKPPDPARFSLNGLALVPTGPNGGTLYAAETGGRNAIEVFTIDWSSLPQLAWRDCLVLPGGGEANAVAVLADGSVVASAFPSVSDTASWAAMDRGEPAGTLWLFEGGSDAPRKLDLGPLSGANGLAASADGRTLHVSDWAGRRLVSWTPATGTTRALPLDFMPDNIHLDSAGRLLVAGQRAKPSAIAACTGPVCRQQWVVARIDPAGGKVETLLDRAGTDAVSYAASAVQWRDKVFLTARSDNRVLYLTGVGSGSPAR